QSVFLPGRWVLVAISAATLMVHALFLAPSRRCRLPPPSPKRLLQVTELNYTSLCFAGKGHGPAAAADYENMKTGTDYVNVDPKKKKADFWTCSSPVAAKSIEYTEVKL
uniref:Uncharacterized protein n=1 Tax=Apteryx owenii TaxID=8824 RepID=A0A8B9PS51_APTOW